jgi:DNA-binding NarL/FixJ family response regulator
MSQASRSNDPSRQGPFTPAEGPIVVFLVDDNPEVAASLKRWFGLSKELHWGGWLANPEGIEEALKQLAPTVLLVDWNLPGTDTAALLARLTRAFPDTRIAVMSVHIKPQYIRAALAAGAAGYIFKNQPPSHLAAEVHMLASGRQVLSPEVRQAISDDPPDPMAA